MTQRTSGSREKKKERQTYTLYMCDAGCVGEKRISFFSSLMFAEGERRKFFTQLAHAAVKCEPNEPNDFSRVVDAH